jgi:hypothetical protein
MRSGGTTRTDARGPAGWRAACSAARRRRGHARFVRRLAPARGGQCARALGCEPVQSACAPPWRRTAWTPRVANESQLPAALHSWMGDARAHRMKFHAARRLGRRQTQHARTVTSLPPILKKTQLTPDGKSNTVGPRARRSSPPHSSRRRPEHQLPFCVPGDRSYTAFPLWRTRSTSAAARAASAKPA